MPFLKEAFCYCDTLMKRYYKIFLLLFFAAFIASVLYFAVLYTTKETITLVRQDLSEDVEGEGVVAAASEVNVGFVAGGRIAEVYVKEGNTVKRDDVLMRLDSAEKESERAQYEAKIEVEKLKLSQLLSGAGKKEIALIESKITATASLLENARKELEDAKLQAENGLFKQYELAVDYGDTILLNAENAAHALTGIYDEQNKFKDVFVIEDSQKKSEAEWQIMLQRSALENIMRAYRNLKQDISREDIDSALSNLKTNLEVIRATLQKTSEVLNDATMIFGAPDISGYRITVAIQRSVVNATQTEILKLEQNIASQAINGLVAVHAAENKVAENENALRTLEHELALKKAFTTNAAITLQQAQIREYESNLEVVKQRIADSALRAPFDSVVRRVNARRGSMALQNTTTAVLAPLSDLQIDVTVSAEESKKIKVGDAADIIWQKGKSSGNVASIRDGIIIVHFKNENVALSPKERVTVRIHTMFKNGVLLVPKRFIKEENGMPYVYVQENGEKKKTAVFIGIEWHDNREVAEGVAEGNILVQP